MILYENLRKLNKPFMDELKKVFSDTLDSGWYILGDNVSLFEEEFADYIGTKYCIGVASGLDALILSLDCCDFPIGSEVIVPSNTYIATILAIIKSGLKPVLVEPDIRTYNIDTEKLEKVFTSKTVAVMAVHLYGKACDMYPIVSFCKDNELKLIEDCAQSHGAEYKGQLTGSFGDFGAFSFYPTKNLGALGDAGAICTDNKEFADKLKALRNYGSQKKYVNKYLGMNSRLDEIQAAFLRVKLKYLNLIIAHKRKLALIYNENLDDVFIKPVVDSNYKDVYHIYNIRTDKRDQLRKYLSDKGIASEIHYPVAPNKQEAMKEILSDIQTPIAEEIHNTTLSLPISYCHSEEDVNTVCDQVNSFNI